MELKQVGCDPQTSMVWVVRKPTHHRGILSSASSTMWPCSAMWNDRPVSPNGSGLFPPLCPVKARQPVGSGFETDWEMTFSDFLGEHRGVQECSCVCERWTPGPSNTTDKGSHCCRRCNVFLSLQSIVCALNANAAARTAAINQWHHTEETLSHLSPCARVTCSLFMSTQGNLSLRIPRYLLRYSHMPFVFAGV